MTNEIERRLTRMIDDYSQVPKGIPLEIAIRSPYDVGVEKFDCDMPANQDTLVSLERGIKSACLEVQAKPIHRSRPNEGGNDMEPFVIEALCRGGLDAKRPTTKSGKFQTSGYPDIRIERLALLPIYLEVKTYAQDQKDKTFRSFYLSPSDDPKVIDTAHHLLVAFEIEKEDNLYRPVAYEVSDLFGLECDLKMEFNSNNARLYASRRRLAHGRMPYSWD